jgi:hypothetical protein
VGNAVTSPQTKLLLQLRLNTLRRRQLLKLPSVLMNLPPRRQLTPRLLMRQLLTQPPQ